MQTELTDNALMPIKAIPPPSMPDLQPYDATPPAEAARSRWIFAKYTASSLLNKASRIVTGFVILRWISPADFGIWQTLLLIESYMTFMNMGIQSGVTREIPYLSARGDRSETMRIAEVASFHAVTCATLAALSFLVLAAVFVERPVEWSHASLAMACSAAGGFYTNYVKAILRGTREFSRLANIQFVEALLILSAPIFVWQWQFAGLCIHHSLYFGVLSGLCLARNPVRVRPRLNLESALRLLKAGAPIFATGWLISFGITLDRLVLVAGSTTEIVGQYGPALSIVAAMIAMPQAIGSYLLPNISYSLGKNEGGGAIWNMTTRGVVATVVVSLPTGLAAWFLLPWLVPTLLPKYAPALPAMKIAILTGVAFGVHTYAAALRALKAWRYLFAFVGVFLTSKAACLFILLQLIEPMEAIAWGGFIGAATSALFVLLSVRLATRRLE